jgi:branched-chain amino acid transport system substrate-binding protein
MRRRPAAAFPRHLFLILTATLSLVIAGCSSSSSDDTSGGSGSGSAASDPFGTPNKATGSPIVIGFNNPGARETGSAIDMNVAARAVVKYANDYLGGIHGHVVQLDECDHLDVPAKQIDCANTSVQKKVSAVVQGNGDDNTMKIVGTAGIPVFTGLTASTIGLTTPNVYSMGNGLAAFGGAAEYFKSINAKKVSMITVDVPAATGPAKAVATPMFKNVGTALDITPVAPGTADMTPQISAAQIKEPDAYWVFGSANFCTSALKSIKTVSPETKILIYGTCITTEKTSIPGGYAGMKVQTGTTALDPTDPEYKLFVEMMDKYEGAATTIGAYGYSPTLALIRLLNAVDLPDPSAAGVNAAIQGAPEQDIPLGAGATFQCNGMQLSASKNICSVASILADADEAGNLTNFVVSEDKTIYDYPK